MSKFRTVFVLILIFLASCQVVKLAIPTEDDAKRGALKYPGYDLTTLQNDKILFLEKCTTCHGIQDPTRKSARTWPKIVTMMAKAARKKPDKVISESEQIAITRYLVTMSFRK